MEPILALGVGLGIAIVALVVLGLNFLSLRRDIINLNEAWKKHYDIMKCDEGRIDYLTGLVGDVVVETKKLEGKVVLFQKAVESVFAQEVELTKLVRTVNDRVMDISADAAQLERGKVEMEELYEKIVDIENYKTFSLIKKLKA